jgi:hypothetical protein
MQAVRILAVMVAIMVILPASVFGVYNNATPVLGTSGAPALAGGAPSLYSGIITVLYADGAPVVLSSNKATFNICSTTCINVDATLKQTAPGTYTYTFTPPSLTGTVTIYVKAESLADDNGKIFPSVDTSVGTYASPSTTSSSSALPSDVPAAQSLPGSPVSPESNQLTQQAVPESPIKEQTPIMQVVLALVVLSLVAVGLLIIPSRRK